MTPLNYALAALLATVSPALAKPVQDEWSSTEARLISEGTAYQPLRQPVEHVSSNGRLDVSLDVRAARYEGVVSFNTRLFEGQFPGPTIRVRAGDALNVTLTNSLGPNNDEHVVCKRRFNILSAPPPGGKTGGYYSNDYLPN